MLYTKYKGDPLQSDDSYTVEFAIEGSFDVSVRVPGTDIEVY